MKEQVTKTMWDVVAKKRSVSSTTLEPLFEKVWTEVLKKVDSSTRIYPIIYICWEPNAPRNLKMKCIEEKDYSLMPLEPLTLPLEDIEAYIKDVSAKDTFKNFDIKVSKPLFLVKGTSKSMEGLTVRVDLKTLF